MKQTVFQVKSTEALPKDWPRRIVLSDAEKYKDFDEVFALYQQRRRGYFFPQRLVNGEWKPMNKDGDPLEVAMDAMSFSASAKKSALAFIEKCIEALQQAPVEPKEIP